ncbi:uncharacterized protein Dwil_GK27255 [Drosophila willistoni]|uniref:Uncharacterized protein n=1 Tax=Drosophila willistoni TaxID=7260 RepID=A0A0Q9WYH3_DROWI|nr:uncharacterized protein Dwil_GK27255 [Drosophila willistoni]
MASSTSLQHRPLSNRRQPLLTVSSSNLRLQFLKMQQLLAELNQHQLAGKQHQPAAQVSQPRASSSGVTQLQQFAIPAPPMSANIQYSQQIKAQQQHQLVGQQQQPTAQASQLRALSFADTQQQQPATHAPLIGGNSLSLQILAELKQHQLTGQQHQPAAQVSQLRASSFADTQQQQSDIPAPPMTANIQYSRSSIKWSSSSTSQQHRPPSYGLHLPLTHSSSNLQLLI